MATVPKDREPKVAKVDHLVDENGSPVDVPDDSALEVANELDPSVGATSPTNWWLYGLVGLGIVVVILFLMQIFGGAGGTDVETGTPTSEPMVEAPAETPTEPQ